MIRVVLRGRTGNNLFQYAVGRHLSLKHHVPLRLDGSWMNKRDYSQAKELLRLPIHADLTCSLNFPARALRAATGHHWLEWSYFDIWKEPENDHRFNPKLLELGESTMLIGYFQSWLYFNEIRDVLLRELDLSIIPWTEPETILRERLKSCQSVAVHVRRTDYLDHDLTRVCGESYQHSAIQLLRENLCNPEFFIFSDDPEWCRKTFGKETDCYVVEIPGSCQNPFIDMRLMSLARHNVIVNSSYSWWGAWLNIHPGQIVIAPDKWGNGGALAPIQEKLMPHWRMLKC